MNTIALLQMAIALLIAAQQPNVPADMRATAITLANTAIQVSMQQPDVATVPVAAPVTVEVVPPKKNCAVIDSARGRYECRLYNMGT